MKDRKSREATQSAWTQWLRGLRFVDEQGCVILHVIHCGGIAGVNVDLSTFLFLLLCVHKQSSLACVFALEGKKRAPALLRATMTPARCGSCTLCSPPPRESEQRRSAWKPNMNTAAACSFSTNLIPSTRSSGVYTSHFYSFTEFHSCQILSPSTRTNILDEVTQNP